MQRRLATGFCSVNSQWRISPDLAIGYPSFMGIKEIRKSNLQALVHEFGSLAEIAKRADTAPAYISQILGGHYGGAHKSPRSVGDSLAKKLEEGCDKPPGWMDLDHSVFIACPAWIHETEFSAASDRRKQLAQSYNDMIEAREITVETALSLWRLSKTA